MNLINKKELVACCWSLGSCPLVEGDTAECGAVAGPGPGSLSRVVPSTEPH